MKIINANEFEELVINHKGKVLVDFFASWCGPCKMLTPILEELDNELENVNIYKVDVDENSELAQNYRITSVPFMILFINGEPLEYINGYQPKEIIENWLKK